MGLEQSVMVDKRSLRRIHRAKFEKALDDWRSVNNTTEYIEESAKSNSDSGNRNRTLGFLCILRVRPLFQHEEKSGDFNVVDARPDCRSLVVHHCCMRPDLIRLRLKHKEFLFDQVFDSKTTNSEVYASLRPLVLHGFSGGMSTIFAFGQTGSGKTYTIRALCNRIACDLFELKRKHLEAGDSGRVNICISSFQLSGSKCSDLLLPSNQKIRMLEDGHGCVHIKNIHVEQPQDAQGLKFQFDTTFNNRATAETVHKYSSRSHAIICVAITNADTFTEGKILLVDLAGSEQNRDTVHHNVERRAETIDILTSLMALKNCIRAMRNGCGRIPFRESKLTQILKASFTEDYARTAVVTTVSPGSFDTEHTLTTLKNISLSHKLSKASVKVPDNETRHSSDKQSKKPRRGKIKSNIDKVHTSAKTYSNKEKINISENKARNPVTRLRNISSRNKLSKAHMSLPHHERRRSPNKLSENIEKRTRRKKFESNVDKIHTSAKAYRSTGEIKASDSKMRKSAYRKSKCLQKKAKTENVNPIVTKTQTLVNVSSSDIERINPRLRDNKENHSSKGHKNTRKKKQKHLLQTETGTKIKERSRKKKCHKN